MTAALPPRQPSGPGNVVSLAVAPDEADVVDGRFMQLLPLGDATRTLAEAEAEHARRQQQHQEHLDAAAALDQRVLDGDETIIAEAVRRPVQRASGLRERLWSS